MTPPGCRQHRGERSVPWTGRTEKTTPTETEAEDGMALKRHECEQTPAGGEGQGGLACCRPWGRAESDTTERRGKNRIELHQLLDW